MKRFLCFLLILLLALGCLSGCGASDDTALYQAGYDQGLADAQAQLQDQLDAARAEGYAQAQAEGASQEAVSDSQSQSVGSQESGEEFARGYESGLADLDKVSQAQYEAGYRDGTSYGLQTALEILADETGTALSSSQEESSPVQVVVGNITQVLGSDTLTQEVQVPQAPAVTAILSAAAAEQDHQAEAAQAEAQAAEQAAAEAAAQAETETSAAAVELSGVTVYVTSSGTKYHNAGCSYLKGNGTAIDKAQAEASGYSACSRCKP